MDFLCKTLKTPRSSYYKWVNRQIPEKEKQDNEVANLIMEYQRMYNGILGYRRMTMFINRLNQTNFSIKYIHRLMKATKMQARIRRKKYNYIKSKPEQTGENILNRDFTAAAPNQKWCTDVTEFKIDNQKRKVYLSAIIDLYDKSIIGYKFKLDKANIIQSMSRVGKCIDNGPMEGFWGTLKSEMFYGIKWKDENLLRQRIADYIDFYNNKRFQQNLKGMTPNEFRNHALSI